MRRRIPATLLAALALLFCTCDDGGEAEEEEFVLEFHHTVTLSPEMALVMPTGELIAHADFISGDLVTYKNQTIKIQSGCETSQAHCRPLFVCRPSPSSLPATFETFNSVCMTPPPEDEPSIIANAETGMGFTVQLNSSQGYAKVWVKEVKGIGDSASVTLVYSLLGTTEPGEEEEVEE